MRYSELLDKPTNTVEELARKHGVPVSYIQAQLKRGIAVEHEHTKKTNLATEIALDHLGEDPDYYKKLAKVEVDEAFDQPYAMKWEKSEADDSMDALVRLPDGSNLSIMFNMDYDEEGEEVVQAEFWRNNSQEVTGEGDAQRIFATVLAAIQQYIKKHKPKRLSFSASKEVDMDADHVEKFNPESRAKLYDRLVQRYSRAWGYRAFRADTGTIVRYELSRLAKGVAENFADGRHPEDKGDSKRYGVPTKASVSTLRKVAKQGGRKGQLAHWMANMKAGRAKKK